MFKPTHSLVLAALVLAPQALGAESATRMAQGALHPVVADSGIAEQRAALMAATEGLGLSTASVDEWLADNPFSEDHAHGVRNLVQNPALPSPVSN